MKKALPILLLLAALPFAAPSHAQDRVTLGWGRLFTNDALGDQHDRWHTGSYSVSKLTGLHWSGSAPSEPGEILEYRFTADTVAPANLIAPAADDRRYAGALSLGAATHFKPSGFDAMLGAGLTAIGPMTGLGEFQSRVHDLLGMDVPTTVLEDQIPNQILPYGTAEMARMVSLTRGLTLRPFVSAQLGPEDLVRFGADVIMGRMGQSDLLLRDTGTGHLYRGIAGDVAPQLSLIIGADYASVFHSVYLPEGGPAPLTPHRTRLRAGYLWQGENAFVFSGLTYLSPEFDTQPEGQVVGSFTVSFSF